MSQTESSSAPAPAPKEQKIVAKFIVWLSQTKAIANFLFLFFFFFSFSTGKHRRSYHRSWWNWECHDETQGHIQVWPFFKSLNGLSFSFSFLCDISLLFCVVLCCFCLFSTLKYLESTLTSRRATLLAKLPEIQSSLEAIDILEKKVIFFFTFLSFLSSLSYWLFFHWHFDCHCRRTAPTPSTPHSSCATASSPRQQ